MKRQSISEKKRFERRRCMKARKDRVRTAINSKILAKTPQEFRATIKIDCPSHLSLSQNYVPTIQFFQEIKLLSSHILRRRRFRPTLATSFSIGLGNLESISVRCAVMLTSELERLQQVSSAKLIYTGSTTFETEALSLLRQMGCFDLLGIKEQFGELEEPNCPEINLANGHRTAMRLISGRQIDSSKFEKFEQELSRIYNNFEHLKILNGAMGEAILNVKNHAYLSDMELEYPSPGKRWWSVASITPSDAKLKIIVFDQGHGIGRTLPKTGFMEHLVGYFGTLSLPYVNSTDVSELVLLKAAISRALDIDPDKPRRTRTGLRGRGKGLGDILKPIKMVDGSSIRVASGEAEVTYDKSTGIVGRILPCHLGGTLVEWIFDVSRSSIQKGT